MFSIKPYFAIWFRPRDTIQKIVEENPNKGLFVLATVYGFISLLGIGQAVQIGHKLHLIQTIIVSIVLAPFWGYFLFSFMAGILFYVGRFLKGQSSYRQLRTAVAWSNVPSILNMVLWILLFVIFRNDLFKNMSKEYSFTQNEASFLFLIFLIQLLLSLWSLVILVNTVSQVQKFSIGKSIANIAIQLMIMLIVIFIVEKIFLFFVAPAPSQVAFDIWKRICLG